MGPFDMVAFIVLVAVIGGVIRSIVKARSASAAGGALSAEQTAPLVPLTRFDGTLLLAASEL